MHRISTVVAARSRPALVLLGLLLTGGVPAPTTAQTASRSAADEPTPRRVATMSDLMVHVLYPASDAIFYIETRTPTTEAGWGVLTGQALMVAEAANLLMSPAWARDDPRWAADAALMLDAGEAAYRAAKARDVEALVAVNDALYQSCVQCHRDFRPDYGRPRGGEAVRFTVAAYNIKHGRGMDDEVDLARVAEVLRRLDADVITLQEVDKGTERTGRVDQVAVLAELLGYEGFHGAHRPYQGGEYGNAILTRLPVRRARTLAIPSASGSALAVHEVEVDVTGMGPVSVVSVHLAGTPDERMAQADSVTSFFTRHDHPVVLAGDFNGRPDDPVVERLGRSWTILEKEGDPSTYPADAPDREIDFVMVRTDDPLSPVGHRVVPESEASDHRPIVATFGTRARR